MNRGISRLACSGLRSAGGCASAAGDSELERIARRSIAAWQPGLPRLKAVMPGDISFTQASFTPDGKSIVAVSNGKTLQIWDVAAAESVALPLDNPDEIIAAAVNPDGRTVLTASAGGIVRVWDSATGMPAGKPLVLQGAILEAAFSADGKSSRH